MDKIEERLMEIEISIANQEKVIDDLNQVIISQGKTIDCLLRQNNYLLCSLKDNDIKPLSEETPPPHY